MAKNLTEVIGTMEKDQQKEFYQASLNKGKIFVIVNALLWNIMVTFCFLAALKSRSMNQIIYAYICSSHQYFCFRKKYSIKKSLFNLIDIKLHFLYTILLNSVPLMDQIVNLYIETYYQNLGPFRSFNLWWSSFVLENLGEYNN